MTLTVGFIGGGRVTRFLLDGWSQAGVMPPDVLVTDPDTTALERLLAAHPNIRAVPPERAGASELVVLAVHPPVMKAALEQIRSHLRPDALLLSLAPKWTLRELAALSGIPRWIRMIPNAPSAIGRGYNPVSSAGAVEPERREEFRRLAAPWGESPEVPERDLEAYAMISAMGPTYLWFQWQALRELAREFGLGPADADCALFSMIRGAAELMFEGGRRAEDVMDTIPVRPLKDDEQLILSAYRQRLPAVWAKIRPQETTS